MFFFITGATICDVVDEEEMVGEGVAPASEGVVEPERELVALAQLEPVSEG